MNDLMLVGALLVALFFFLGAGVWVGASLIACAIVGMALFTSRPIGDSMAITIWGSLSSWTLTSLPLFIWMGEILYRTKISETLFRGLTPWMYRLPGGLLHVNITGSAVFAAISGSSAATVATVGKMSIPELKKRKYSEKMIVGTLAGAGTLGLLIPPSVSLIIYAVTVNESIVKLFVAGILPGLMLAGLFMGFVAVISFFSKPGDTKDLSYSWSDKLKALVSLSPVLALIICVIGSIYTGIATATEAAVLGVIGSLLIALLQRSLDFTCFKESLMGAIKTSSMIAFAVAALVIIIAGSKLAKLSDSLADQTGLGEALFGVLLLAGVTSLPDFAATLTAAIDARPNLAMSNVMGSMAANLVFLAVADIVYRKANLEHAAASAVNLMLAGLLIVLLTLPLLAVFSPSITFFNIHPITPVIIIAYISGLHLVLHTKTKPMWFPRQTCQTVADQPDTRHSSNLTSVWITFICMAALTGIAGWVLMESAKQIADQTGISETLMGGFFTALATSTPELVTTIVAIRIGALTLAVSNIFGTNCFNMLVVAAADVGYTQGSIYHDMAPVQVIWALVSILMTATLLLGMVRRQTYGIGKIGFESALILAIYGIALGFVILS